MNIVVYSIIILFAVQYKLYNIRQKYIVEPVEWAGVTRGFCAYIYILKCDRRIEEDGKKRIIPT